MNTNVPVPSPSPMRDKPAPVNRPRKSYMEASLESLSKVIDTAKDNFSRMKEERRIRDLYDRVCRLRFLPEERILNEDMYNMIESMHLQREYLPESLKRFEILLKTRCINGIGFWNENGGIAFYSPQIGDIANIGEKGVTMLYAKKNQKSNSVCVFENFLDYLAYKMIMSLGKHRIESDILIVNSVCNFITTMFDCDNYKQVFCFFRKNQESSQVMNVTLLKWLVGISKDMSYIYSDSGCNSLLELVATLDQKESV